MTQTTITGHTGGKVELTALPNGEEDVKEEMESNTKDNTWLEMLDQEVQKKLFHSFISCIKVTSEQDYKSEDYSEV